VDTYVIIRRNGWGTADERQEAARRSKEEAERMPEDVAWMRSYVLTERDETLGTICVFQASSPEALRRHAADAELPIDEIIKVTETVIDLSDPTATAAAV
jgi:hypothetical protein